VGANGSTGGFYSTVEPNSYIGTPGAAVDAQFGGGGGYKGFWMGESDNVNLTLFSYSITYSWNDLGTSWLFGGSSSPFGASYYKTNTEQIPPLP
jgi:hypothetical protein